MLLLLGVGFFTLIGQVLLTEAYKYGAAAFLSPISYSIIIYTSMISWIFFSALPGISSLIGMLCVIIGGVLTFVLTAKPKKIVETAEENKKLSQNNDGDSEKTL